MAFEIVKVCKEHALALRFVGKRYVDSDRVDGGFGGKWQEWFRNGWLVELEKLGPSRAVENGCLGLMTVRTDPSQAECPFTYGFAYWIGMLFPAGTAVPAGFEHLDLPESDLGVAWIRGDDRTGEIYGPNPHSAAEDKLSAHGWATLRQNAGGDRTIVFFERYNGERFTTRDELGNVILDYGFYIE